jgi:microcystin-dependent protein
MSEQYVSEIRIVSFNYPPKGWAFCNGQLLPINQNQALFSLLGTTYGGNGQTTFALPNLQGRAAVSMGAGYTIGQIGGEPAHTLTSNETPTHLHAMMSANVPADTAPAGVTPGPTLALAQAAAFEGTGNPTKAVSIYSTATANATLAANAIGPAGGGQPHENHQPYLTLNFCIALIGIFPSRN